MIAVSVDGKNEPLEGFQQRKMVSKGHWMWVGQAPKRDTIALKTLLDTLRATRFAGGAGTYTLNGNSYTEQIEYFAEPGAIGMPFHAECRVEGDTWYHTWMAPFNPKDTISPKQKVVETWKKIG